MKKKFLLLAVTLWFFCAKIFAQTIIPQIQWQNTIGGSGADYLNIIQQTSDGGYILGGGSTSGISGDKTENGSGEDYWIVKTDAYGNIQWQNTIGGTTWDRLYCVQQTNDGGYILGGTSLSNISGDKTENSNGAYDYWVVKTNSTGQIQWQNTIGGSGDDWLQSIQQTNSGGYIIGGYSYSNISGDKTENNKDITGAKSDYWVVKLSSSGNIQWQNTIGGTKDDFLYSAKQTSDGGFVFAGRSESNSSTDKTENSNGGFDYWVVKTNSTGQIQWQNTIGGNDLDDLNSIQQTSDGGYILGGWSVSDISGDKSENSAGLDYWIIKTDLFFNIQWQKTIGGSGFDWCNSVRQTTDGGYIIGGYSTSNISGNKTENCLGNADYWIIKLDGTGNIQWQNTLGGTGDDELSNVFQTSDGGFILGGWSTSNISTDKSENSMGVQDYWILKLTPDNCTSCSQPNNLSASNLSNTSEKILWDIQPCALAYQIKFRVVGSSTWTTQFTTGNWGYKTLINLSPNSSYQYEVRSICQQNPYVYSGYTSIQIFTTPLRLEDETVTPTNFSIYPNPTTNSINISSSSLQGNYSLKIYNLLGEQVKLEQHDFSDLENYKLSVAELPAGYYRLLLNNTKDFFSKGFIKE